MRRTPHWEPVAGLLAALSGAVAWAVGLTVAQPLSEPAKPWLGGVTTNNMYWARDLRWAAVVVVLVALVLSVRGDRRLSIGFAAVAVGWLAVDTWLDRVDVHGPAAKPWTIAAACAAVVGLWLAAQLRTRTPSRAPLLVAALVAGAVAPMVAITWSPDEIDPAILLQLNGSLSALLTALAVTCAFSSAERHSRTRLALAAGFAAVTSLQYDRVHTTPMIDRYASPLLLGTLLFCAAIVLSASAPRTLRPTWAGVASIVGTLLAYPLLTISGFLVDVGFRPSAADALTKLAGNPVINSADTDSIHALTGTVIGLFFSAVALSAPALFHYLDETARLASTERAALQ